MAQQRKVSLRMKSVLVVTAMALIMAAAAIVMSYRVYANTMDEHYKMLTINVARTAATQMDYGRLQHYIETSQKDAKYEELRHILRTFNRATT
jgi:sigma-B regulation protein RsbU (phosphoserine phosphatase)